MLNYQHQLNRTNVLPVGCFSSLLFCFFYLFELLTTAAKTNCLELSWHANAFCYAWYTKKTKQNKPKNKHLTRRKSFKVENVSSFQPETNVDSNSCYVSEGTTSPVRMDQVCQAVPGPEASFCYVCSTTVLSVVKLSNLRVIWNFSESSTFYVIYLFIYYILVLAKDACNAYLCPTGRNAVQNVSSVYPSPQNKTKITIPNRS